MQNIMTSFANFWGGGIVLMLGLALRFIKGTEVIISGYSTMSKAEREKWNGERMRLFIGAVLICTSSILIAAGAVAMFDFYPKIVILVSWVLFVGIILISIAYMNASPKFKK